MKREIFARELMIDELRKERGKFVTLRIIDRMMILYAPLFNRRELSHIADNINQERKSRKLGSSEHSVSINPHISHLLAAR